MERKNNFSLYLMGTIRWSLAISLNLFLPFNTIYQIFFFVQANRKFIFLICPLRGTGEKHSKPWI